MGPAVAAQGETAVPGGVFDRSREGDGRQEPGPDPHRAGGAVRGEAAGHRPHAVRDRPGKAEETRGQRVQVDGVAVAGDGGVTAAEVAAEAPLGERGQRGQRRCFFGDVRLVGRPVGSVPGELCAA
jgi:hypothetical protein